GRFRRSHRGRRVLFELVADDLDRGRVGVRELAVDVASPDAPLHPDHADRKRAEDGDEHDGVPEGEPCAQRERHRSISAAASWYPSPRLVRMIDVPPGRSSLRRSRCTYTSTTFDSGS